MKNWKLAVIAGSAGLGALLLLKGKKPAGLIVAGVGLTTLASEYPEKIREVRDNFHEYAEHGAVLLDVASRIGERIGEMNESPAYFWRRILAG
jgi:hypothetical protein